MAQIAYRANLSAAVYPMTIADGGRTVIIPGPDQNFDRRVDPQGEQKDAGIPQALYLENVMPTSNGYQSVGYLQPSVRTMTVPSGATHIKQCIEIPAQLDFVGPATFTTQIKFFPLYLWDTGAFTAGIFGDRTVTYSGASVSNVVKMSIAIVTGKTYLFCRSSSASELYEVFFDTSQNIILVNRTGSVTPSGFLGIVESICSSNNYLIAHSPITVYWSSTTTPLDFDSSLVSGAGNINPNSSENLIQYIKETANGFYVYCRTNTLYAQYTGNARYPFRFVPVINSTGIYENYNWCVAGTVDTPGHYVIEKNKNIKFLQGATATAVAPELSDFLGKTPAQEFFNYITNVFSASIVETVVPSIYIYQNRYIVVSVNGTQATGAAADKYTHAIVFDSVLNRYGKLKVDHSFLFTSVEAQEVLAFVDKQNRKINFLSFDIYQFSAPFEGLNWVSATAVLALGKFQYVRSRKIQLHEIEIEGPQNSAIVPTPNFSCVLLPSLDGRTFDAPVTPVLRQNSGGLASYNAHATAQNHTIVLKGAFNVNTLQLRFSPRGER